jgi:3',5'-cyclic AMP phosphodiesterase CpdA
LQPEWEDGYLLPSTRPGFDVEFDREAAKRHPFRMAELPQTDPSPREPYVQGVTAYSAVICWVSADPDAGVVEYGKTPALGHKVAPYRNLIKTVPIFPVLGNHDVRKGNGAAFLENFHPTLGSPGSTKRYYSFVGRLYRLPYFPTTASLRVLSYTDGRRTRPLPEKVEVRIADV